MTAAETKMCELWADVLGLDGVDLDGDFVELGGDSLAAEMLIDAVAEEFDVELPASAVVDITTPRVLAARVASGSYSSPDDPIAVRAGGTRPPLFVIHNGLGEVFFARRLARHLGSDQPLYALQPPQGDALMASASLDELARAYIAAAKRVQSEGPYMLYGDCLGGLIAFEMAAQMVDAGDKVGLLAVGDVVAPSLVKRVDDLTTRGQIEIPARYAVRLARQASALRGGTVRATTAASVVLVARELRRGGSLLRWRMSRDERRRRRIDTEMLRRVDALAKLFTSYSPSRRFSGGTLVISSSDTWSFWGLQPEHSLGWARDVDGPLREVKLACMHAQRLSEPFIGEMATFLRSALDDAAPTL
jgi:thioesterase domain-containing protein/acyl carrier protein